MNFHDLNPFDLPGPEFLVFYLVLAGLVYVGYRLMLHRTESGEATALPLSDPYQIAYLRGGRFEAARVAVVSLVDRGRIAIVGDKIGVRGSATGLAPIEEAVIHGCSPPVSAPRLLRDRAVAKACETFQTSLEELGLVPDSLLRAWRWQWFALAAAPLLVVGLVKIDIALGRGRTNVSFLIVLMAAAVLLLIAAAQRRRTALGDAVLSDLQHLFSGLHGQIVGAADGGATSDAMLLAAVFGVSALPSLAFGEIQRVFAKANQGGSSCGSSCGSGCGGGGGGCGGCGGS